MTPETFFIAALIAAAIHLVRAHRRQLAEAWNQAHWWEKGILLVALLPIPGPVDELAGLIVLRRVSRRSLGP